MTRSNSSRILIAATLLVSLSVPGPLPAQGNSPNQDNPNRGRGPGPQGTARERMWFAPTQEDWKKPVLIQWQRTWEDAVAVAKETRKPILVCVNMDGEIASEHYAGVRYRQPDIAKLYEPYVCVIASVYRHNERDHDEHGHRIPCPRFGGVTCGEHIAIEPFIFEKFLDGERVSPRHIMVEVLDGEPRETYDVYYTMDTKSVFGLIENGIAQRTIQPLTIDRGDRSIVDRVASRDSQDRSAVELAYQSADAETQKAMLEQALAQGADAPLELLRLAIFGVDPDQARLARKALAQSDRRDALWLIGEALRTPMPATEREQMLAALDRLGQQHKHARTLAVVHRGLGPEARAAVAGGKYPAPGNLGFESLAATVEDRERAAAQQPASGEAKLALAEASLRLAVDPKTKKTFNVRGAVKYQRLMFQDARRAARQAQKLGAKGWRLDSVLALTAYYLGEIDEAYRHAERAVADLPKDAKGYNAIATIALFGQRRLSQLRRAMRTGEKWPGQWLADVHSAYSVLAEHPLGTEEQVVAHYDLLADLRAGGKARTVLERGLRRFPDSVELHSRQRYRGAFVKGPLGMERQYAEWVDQGDEYGPNIRYFAALASLDAADLLRRRNRPEAAIGAYGRAIAGFVAHVKEHAESADSCTHCTALALSGRSRAAFELGRFSASVDDLVASIEMRPDLVTARDILNLSAIDTANALRAKLAEKGVDQDGALAKLQSALAKLPAEAFEKPAFERSTPGAGINIPGALRGEGGGSQRGGRRARGGRTGDRTPRNPPSGTGKRSGVDR